MASSIKISICVVNWNTCELTRECVETILAHAHETSLEIILVDNGSEDGSPDRLAEYFPDITLIRNNKNLGFVKANNQAIEKARGEYIMLLNSDTIVLEGMFHHLVSYMDRHSGEVGGVSPRMFIDRTQLLELPPHPCLTPFMFAGAASRVGRSFAPLKRYWARNRAVWRGDYSAIKVPALVGACLMVPKVLIDGIGGLDPRFFMFFEDMMLSHRIRQKGLDLAILSEARLIHLFNRSGEKNPEVEQYFIDGMKIAFPELYGHIHSIMGVSVYKLLERVERQLCRLDGNNQPPVKSQKDSLLEWNPVRRAAGYFVEISHDSAFLGVVGAITEKPAFSLESLMEPETDGRVYFWRWTPSGLGEGRYRYGRFKVSL